LTSLTDRLAGLSNLEGIPREELEWLAAHGELEVYEAGTVVAAQGEPVEKLWVILSGRTVVDVDRGAGPRRVMEWRTGEVTGMLPYSRMTAPPGDNYVEEWSELLTVHQSHFPEMVRRCPRFTAYTVHLMLDRARSFNTVALQDEKMIALGRLAAGLAHELNNPASAAARGAKQLLANLAEVDASSRTIGAAGLDDGQLDALRRVRDSCLTQARDAGLTPLQQADREDEIAEWLARHRLDPMYAGPLADTAVTLEALDGLTGVAEGATLDAALGWIVAGCSIHALALDVEHAATRIHELVAAVKRFSYMDNLAGPEPVDLEVGLRDTVRVMASKAKSKGATINLELDPKLPRVHATGSELNQVWLNLIDNALDAVHESGHVDVSARAELDRVVVRVVDDGPGVPPELLPRIFEPFFTTKAPGHGTGLGLDIALRLVRRYRGDIAAESRPGRTEFRVTLPTE
jgi:signal transduction histidine kinase